MARRRAARWFTWTYSQGGEEYAITWTDGVLSGDPFLIEVFLYYAADVPDTIDPIPYSSGAGWQADPIVAHYIAAQIGRPIRRHTNIPRPQWVKGRVY